MNNKPLSILFVSSECAPFAKTGGLGDVVGALPGALRTLGHDCRVLLPLYGDIDRAAFKLTPDGSACIHMGRGIEHWVGILKGATPDGTPCWFLDFGEFFKRPGIYGTTPTADYPDNAYRFSLLAKAALQLCTDRQFIPDILHTHDWPSALTSVFLKTLAQEFPAFSASASVLTIHNIGHQGKYSAEAFSYFGLPSHLFTPSIFEDYGKLNLLKAGIHFADAVTTVSPTHAAELLEPVGGQGLAPFLLQKKQLTGILNGVDYQVWNPETDSFIPAPFSPQNLTGKSTCKHALQQQFNLPQQEDTPLIGIVSRLAFQKGFNLLQSILSTALRNTDFQLVLLGSGDPALQTFFMDMQRQHPTRIGCHIGFSEALSHLIEAGADFFLMPSLYEPCGLNQIYSMKYATLPIVRATGGLQDTVVYAPDTPEKNTGFKFSDPTPEALASCITQALSTWRNHPDQIKQMRQTAMKQNFSWESAAEQYTAVYRKALRSLQR